MNFDLGDTVGFKMEGRTYSGKIIKVLNVNSKRVFNIQSGLMRVLFVDSKKVFEV